MATFQINKRVVTPNQTIDLAQSYTGSLGITLDETATQSTTTEFGLTLDVSAVKAFVVTSDKAVTLKTNDSGTPDDTLSLLANKPYEWNTDSYDTFKFGTDITSLFVTVAGGTAARIQLEAIVDATP